MDYFNRETMSECGMKDKEETDAKKKQRGSDGEPIPDTSSLIRAEVFQHRSTSSKVMVSHFIVNFR